MQENDEKGFDPLGFEKENPCKTGHKGPFETVPPDADYYGNRIRIIEHAIACRACGKIVKQGHLMR